MLPKTTVFKTPLDSQAIQLESYLSQISRDGLRGVSGTYTGDGTNNRQVSIGFSPVLIVISKFVDLGKTTFPLGGNIVFALSGNPGVSYVPGTGFVKDAVITFNNTGITVGTNTSVNAAGSTFTYFAIG